MEVKGREVKREKWRLLAGRISTDHLNSLSWKSMDEEITIFKPRLKSGNTFNLAMKQSLEKYRVHVD